MSATVNIMVDSGNAITGADWTPHTFLKITHPDVSTTYAGFAPIDSGLEGERVY